MKIYNLVKPYLKKQIKLIIIYIVSTLVLALSGVIAPYLSGSFIDNLIRNPTQKIIIEFTFFYIILSLIQILFSYIMSIVVVKLQTKVTFELNKDIITHLQKTPIQFIESQNISYLNQRIYTDCSTLISFSITVLNGCIANIVTFVFCFFFIMKSSLEISILMFILILIYVLFYKFLKPPLLKIKHEYKEVQAKYVSSLYEQLSKTKLIKLFNLFDFFSKRLVTRFNDLINTSLKNTKLSFFFQSSDTIVSLISQIILFLFGGFQILNGNLSIGAFTILSSYFGHLLNSSKFFMNLGNQYIENIVSSDRLIEILDVPEEPNGNKHIDCIHSIILKNLSFSFGTNSIISNLNFTFEKNKIYQIYGENGKGKTTLLNLLIGLYSTMYSGEILYNNINAKKIDLNVFRKKNLSFIDQNTLIFDGTIKENICLDSDYLETELENYINIFSLNRYFNSTKDEHINEGTTNLSGGEIKKIALIRSLLKKNTSLWILDEPTNSLDLESIEKLKSILLSNKVDKIIILISHDNIFDNIIDKKLIL